AHKAMTEKAIQTYNLGQRLKTLGPDVMDKVAKPGWLKVNGMPGLDGYYAHPEVARRLQNIMPVANNAPAGLRMLDNSYQSAMKYFKMFALGTPAFQIRNATGNVWLNMADGM